MIQSEQLTTVYNVKFPCTNTRPNVSLANRGKVTDHSCLFMQNQFWKLHGADRESNRYATVVEYFANLSSSSRTYRLTWHKLNTIVSRIRYKNYREKN